MKYDFNLLSDMYKDAYGFRPRDLTRYTEDELKKLYISVQNDLIEEINRDQLDYECTISNFIRAGAEDRATAERWYQETYAN